MMWDILINYHIYMNNIIHMEKVVIDKGGLFGGYKGWASKYEAA